MNAGDFAAHLRARLDAVAAAGRFIDFWWRDDDAIEPTAALDDLLETAARYDVPLALAVIPNPAKQALGDRISKSDHKIRVLQHGFAHRNHAPKVEKAAELGVSRPAETVLEELGRGFDRMTALFGDRFLPVLTPPWNRICDDVAARRSEVGLIGLTTFARMHDEDPACVNTHVDVIDWKGGRKFAGYEKMTAVIDEEVNSRLDNTPKPVGLLTHHLDHDSGVRDFLDAFLSVAGSHPAARWPAIGELFGIATPTDV